MSNNVVIPATGAPPVVPGAVLPAAGAAVPLPDYETAVQGLGRGAVFPVGDVSRNATMCLYSFSAELRADKGPRGIWVFLRPCDPATRQPLPPPGGHPRNGVLLQLHYGHFVSCGVNRSAVSWLLNRFHDAVIDIDDITIFVIDVGGQPSFCARVGPQPNIRIGGVPVRDLVESAPK
jgi:hypothetical protein